MRVAEGHSHDSIPPLGLNPQGRGNFRKKWEMGDVALVYQDRMHGSPRQVLMHAQVRSRPARTFLHQCLCNQPSILGTTGGIVGDDDPT